MRSCSEPDGQQSLYAGIAMTLLFDGWTLEPSCVRLRLEGVLAVLSLPCRQVQTPFVCPVTSGSTTSQCVCVLLPLSMRLLQVLHELCMLGLQVPGPPDVTEAISMTTHASA